MISHFGFSAKTKYYLKNLVSRFFGLLPYGFAIQEKLKKIRGHWDQRIPADAHKKRLQTQIKRYSKYNITPPKIVIEQGTGWTGEDLIILYLAGAEKIITYDTRPWLQETLFKNAAQEILKHLEFFSEWKGVSISLLQERATTLKKSLNKPLPQLLHLLSIDYRVSKKFEYNDIQEGTVDLFFSYSVLQRVLPNDLRQIITRSYDLLKNSGVSCHRIHSQDFNNITDKRIPPLYYLRISNIIWRTITSSFMNYQNRLRIAEFIKIFAETGFIITTGNDIVRPEDIEYAKVHLLEKYPNLTPEEIATYQTDIFARKT